MFEGYHGNVGDENASKQGHKLLRPIEATFFINLVNDNFFLLMRGVVENMAEPQLIGIFRGFEVHEFLLVEQLGVDSTDIDLILDQPHLDLVLELSLLFFCQVLEIF